MDRFSRKDIAAKIRSRVFASGAYNWLLSRSKPGLPTPLEPAFVGDQQRGQSLRLSDFVQEHQTSDNSYSNFQPSSDRFQWLADLQASDLETSVSVAQEIIEIWIKKHNQWTPVAWQLDVLADRICHWISSSSFALAGADPDFNNLFAAAMMRHAKHLDIAVRLGEPVPPGFYVQKAFIYCGMSLESQNHLLPIGIHLLQQSINDEIHADGGHISRNPYLQLMALRHLIEVRSVLVNHSLGAPAWLQSSIDKLAPMLRTFIMGDGQLANFNGATPIDAKNIDLVLKKSEATGRAVTNSPHSGFQRLSARRTILVMDVGVTDQMSGLPNENAGTLAFEMSVGKHRIIVNCGLPTNDHPALQTALRGTSAHSTLCAGETNSSEINALGYLGPRRAWRTHSLRREVDKNTLVEATHDGYINSFQLSHKRSLFLSSDGTELRGEDVLLGPNEQTATVRFHLHPSVQASLVQSGDSVLLKFGKSAGWRFRSSVSNIKLESSIFYEAATRRQSQQIALNVTHCAPQTVIKWRISMEN